jgi:integrase
MPRRAEPLNAAKVKALLAKGEPWRHADGAGLYLVVTGPGRGWWMLRYTLAGRTREMGLGAADAAGREGHALADARDRAAAARARIRDGVDPLAEREALAAAEKAAQAARRTFHEAARDFLADKSAEWSNPKHRDQWRSTLDTYAHPILGDMPVAEIGMEDVRRALVTIWTAKPETATRLRGRIEAVLDFAAVHGWRQGPNPARWAGNLKLAGLPARAKFAPVKHHPALPWQDAPAFMRALRGLDATSARALEVLILTAARTGEVLEARWSEIDMPGAVWTIPAGRMKARREHRVPLSDPALAVLEDMAELRDPDDPAGEGFVFPGAGGPGPLSNMAMLALLKRMRRADITPHGFRSTFRDWAGEATAHPGDVVEMALAHVVANKVEAAYRRGDMFEKRRRLMQDWSDYLGRAPADVVALADRRAATEATGR